MALIEIIHRPHFVPARLPEVLICPIAGTISNIPDVVSARCEETSHYIKELVGLFEEGGV